MATKGTLCQLSGDQKDELLVLLLDVPPAREAMNSYIASRKRVFSIAARHAFEEVPGLGKRWGSRLIHRQNWRDKRGVWWARHEITNAILFSREGFDRALMAAHEKDLTEEGFLSLDRLRKRYIDVPAQDQQQQPQVGFPAGPAPSRGAGPPPVATSSVPPPPPPPASSLAPPPAPPTPLQPRARPPQLPTSLPPASLPDPPHGASSPAPPAPPHPSSSAHSPAGLVNPTATTKDALSFISQNPGSLEQQERGIKRPSLVSSLEPSTKKRKPNEDSGKGHLETRACARLEREHEAAPRVQRPITPAVMPRYSSELF